ncbi:MAG: methylenetetrahydrofolate reductase [NAD(P)H] [Rhodospirillales bacterium]|nr:methylenetetrahydrofolate reductase [NAD(P)H] [Rhodospirillales bacterium]
MTHSPVRHTLERWATGERIAPLPAREGAEPPAISFEFMPPKTPALEAQLWACVERLGPLNPRFVSVTYGAGGSTQESTHTTVVKLARETALTPAAHLTCVGATRETIDNIARQYWEAGVKHIVALRGDPPKGEVFAPYPGGYDFAVDLVAGLRRVADFEISVAAYPEIHPQAVSAEADLDNLKRKLDAGATRAITQMFYDNDAFLRFLDRALAAGIKAPIVPGIMPISNFVQAAKFCANCGTNVPKWMAGLFEGLEDDLETRRMVAAATCAEQVRILQANGIDEFHFITLNRPDLVYAISRILGVKPQPPAA